MEGAKSKVHMALMVREDDVGLRTQHTATSTVGSFLGGGGPMRRCRMIRGRYPSPGLGQAG